MPDLSKLLGEVEDQWSTKKGLLLVLFLVGSSFLWLATSVDLRKLTLGQWALGSLVMLSVSALWWFTRLPRVPRKKVGFGVAILYEEGSDGKKIQADFAGKLRELVLVSSRLRYTFHFVEFKDRVARRFVEGEHERLAIKTNCHFVIYGRAKSRNLFGDPSYVMELKGVVRHGPIQADLGLKFREDFSQLLPSRVVIKDPDSLLLFEFAARHIDVVARYIIGVAAALSGDVPYAEQLLLDARARLEEISKTGDAPVLATLRSRIASRLGEVYDSLLSDAQRKYILKRDLEALKESARLLAKRREVAKDNYFTRQAAALCAFLLDKDIELARREYAGCRHVDDGSWRYGEAFLTAYEGDLDRAYREYCSAFSAPLQDASVPIQCEEFIQLSLEREPDRYWLHFCLGMINHRVKGDLLAASRDFQHFLDRVTPGRFENQVRAVSQWQKEIAARSAPKVQSGHQSDEQ